MSGSKITTVENPGEVYVYRDADQPNDPARAVVRFNGSVVTGAVVHQFSALDTTTEEQTPDLRVDLPGAFMHDQDHPTAYHLKDAEDRP